MSAMPSHMQPEFSEPHCSPSPQLRQLPVAWPVSKMASSRLAGYRAAGKHRLVSPTT
jgi:hypothetical protein